MIKILVDRKKIFHAAVAFFGLASVGHLYAQSSPSYPGVIRETLARRALTEEAARRSVMESDLSKIVSPNERGIVSFLRGSTYLAENNRDEAEKYFNEAAKLIPKQSQLYPLAEVFAMDSSIKPVPSTKTMAKLRDLVKMYPSFAEWKSEQYGLMLDIVMQARADALVVKTWNDFESNVRPSQRSDDVVRRVASYLDKRVVDAHGELISILESMASMYPYSENSGWAFQKLQKLSCVKKTSKTTPYVFSIALLGRLAANSNLDDGLKNFILESLKGPVRNGAAEPKNLDALERISLMFQFRFYGDAQELAARQLEELPATVKGERKARRARLLSQLGQIQVRLGDFQGAIRSYSHFIEEFADFSDIRLAKESIADALVRYRAHKSAAAIYAELALSPSADPVLRWHHFWNTYLAQDLAGALALLDKPGYVPQRDRGIDGGLDYWRARILERLGKTKEAEDLYKKILATNGDSYYSVMINTRRPLITEASVGKFPVGTHDEAAAAWEEFSGRGVLSAKLIAAGSAQGDAMAGSTDHLDVQTSRYLQKWGSYRLAKRLLRTISWSKILSDKMFAEVSTLALSLGDFGYGLKAVSLPDSPLKTVPSAASGMFGHMAKYQDDWKLLYPKAHDYLVTNYSQTANVDPFVILSLMRAESVYDVDARSGVGAQGLMQIMPFTAIRIARMMGDKDFTLSELHTPEVNIGYGAFYFRKLMDYYSGNVLLAVAGYNAGPGSVDRWVLHFSNLEMDEFVEMMPFKETRRYVKSVLKNFSHYKHIYEAKPALANLPVLPDLPTNMEIF